MEYNLHFVHLTSFEVIKIELLDSEISNNSNLVPSGPNSQGGLSTRVANILQNIDISTQQPINCVMFQMNLPRDILRSQTK